MQCFRSSVQWQARSLTRIFFCSSCFVFFQVLHLGRINLINPRAFSALLKSVSPTVTLVGLNILVEVVVELVLLEHHPPKNISAPSRLMRSQKKFKNLHIHNVYLSFSSAVRSNLSPSKATFMIDTTDPRFKFFCLRQLLHTDQRWRPKPKTKPAKWWSWLVHLFPNWL